MIDAIRRVIAELKKPGYGGSPYIRGIIGIAHSVVGAAMAEFFGVYGTGAALGIGAGYWYLKERGDLRRGGAWKDGIEDAIFVAIGAWYGTPWWPIAILAVGFAVMVRAEARR
ncbi:MAG: hypothetical protein OEZ19_00105 [Paracoccaceae bacterium]|nr:hypothetical protein [Paracoccaceae bacterium]